MNLETKPNLNNSSLFHLRSTWRGKRVKEQNLPRRRYQPDCRRVTTYCFSKFSNNFGEYDM